MEDLLLLQSAVSSGSLDLARTLLAAGANVNGRAKGPGSTTALEIAAQTGNIEMVDFLLDSGADFAAPAAYNTGATALQFAPINGFMRIVRRLLNSGADVHAAGSVAYGRTAIQGAAEYGRIDVLQLLLSRIDPSERPQRKELARAVHLAEKEGRFTAVKMVKSACGWSDKRSSDLKSLYFRSEGSGRADDWDSCSCAKKV
ncbi:ankyrin [Penicillium argentinense]|uniref:Ankyrin n=1 Tax=Penicillium argentinense TaxID=1131581 RepID=A0A9W9FD87_9EURO|nr:ankyrin [Penicillium argentinense]KAJ5098090.1 ankyrin [Penicillium argentinense]